MIMIEYYTNNKHVLNVWLNPTNILKIENRGYSDGRGFKVETGLTITDILGNEYPLTEISSKMIKKHLLQ